MKIGLPVCITLLGSRQPLSGHIESLAHGNRTVINPSGSQLLANVKPIYTVSVDEKPGVQAIGLTAPDLPPVPGKAPAVGRDYEYVRHGTVSILAGIDLHSGHVFAQIEDRHRSLEFIALLRLIDAYYPAEAIIRVVLDNHSSLGINSATHKLGNRKSHLF